MAPYNNAMRVEVSAMTRPLLGILLFVCCTKDLFAQELLFSFSPVPNNAASSERAFSPEEVLTVTVSAMKLGERLTLERCGNARCSVAAPVAAWTFYDFERHSPADVYTEGDWYEFLLFNGNRGVYGAEAMAENGVTTLRFTSGTTVTVAVRSSR